MFRANYKRVKGPGTFHFFFFRLGERLRNHPKSDYHYAHERANSTPCAVVLQLHFVWVASEKKSIPGSYNLACAIPLMMVYSGVVIRIKFTVNKKWATFVRCFCRLFFVVVAKIMFTGTFPFYLFATESWSGYGRTCAHVTWGPFLDELIGFWFMGFFVCCWAGWRVPSVCETRAELGNAVHRSCCGVLEVLDSVAVRRSCRRRLLMALIACNYGQGCRWAWALMLIWFLTGSIDGFEIWLAKETLEHIQIINNPGEWFMVMYQNGE